MAELPRGTVSLMFTDIEGSTQLQRRLGDEYQSVVENHRLLLEEALDAHGGTVVDRQTESFFAVFSRTRDAVRAAVQAQRAIADHAWPEGAEPRVRMGIHAGEPELAGDRYVGLAVSRAARICAAGHGGQVLVVSSSARSLLADDDRATLKPLGSYRLKDFSAPEPIYQVVLDDGPAKFPSLRAEGGSTRRRRLLIASGVALAVAAVVAGIVVALGSGDSGSVQVGPTSLAVVDSASNKVVDAIELGFKSNLIDRHALAAKSGYLSLKRTDQILPEGLGRDVSIYPLGVPPARSIAKARVLVAKAEVKPDKLVLYAHIPGFKGVNAAWAEIFKFDVAKLGIDVEIKYFGSFTEVFRRAGTRGEPFDVVIVGWIPDYPDGAAYFGPLLDGNNLAKTGNYNLSYFDRPKVNEEIERIENLTGDARHDAWANLDVRLMR